MVAGQVSSHLQMLSSKAGLGNQLIVGWRYLRFISNGQQYLENVPI